MHLHVNINGRRFQKWSKESGYCLGFAMNILLLLYKSLKTAAGVDI